MIRRLILAATALAGGMLPAPQAARAQTGIDSLGLTVTATPAIATDYLFRGISQTRNRPAASLTLDVEHASGLYVGSFVSNAAFAGTDVRQEVDLLAGYRFSLGELKLDLGGIWYTYPGYSAPAGGFEFNWFEFALRGSYELEPLKFVGGVFYSPNFNLESGQALYVEGGVDIKLDFDITLAARIGFQSVDRNTRFGVRDYTSFSLAASREVFAGVILTLGYYGTDLDQSDCGGLKICENRAMVTLSRPF